MTTFGFEAEFQNNASAVIAALHARGLAGVNHLHSYHCDCESCEFGGAWAFRGQTDSSCSGEIISDVFGSYESDWESYHSPYGDEVALMAALCDIAVEVDAEPGPNSGFHVHVSNRDLTEAQLAERLWQFARWEHVLARVAGGRWSHRREGMNSTVNDGLRYIFDAMGTSRTGTLDDEQKMRLLYQHMGNDRHSNLNISARSHPTWEFRIWNSTRSAWRMEMFCGLSVAFMDQEVVEGLADLAPPRRLRQPNTGIADIALACANAGHDRVAELLERQGAYLLERAADAPPVLTAL